MQKHCHSATLSGTKDLMQRNAEMFRLRLRCAQHGRITGRLPLQYDTLLYLSD